ncbi:Uncharacterised protein [Escherichia coli]|nr:Uncharacterised protein [Escherichia coli]
MAIAHICGLRCVGFGKYQVANHAESRIFPGGHKAIDAVPAIEAHHQRIFFQHAVHFITGRFQPFIGFIAGDGTPLTVTETDEIWRVGEDEIDSIARKRGHNTHAVPLDKTGHNSTPSLTEGTGRAPLWRPFPAACGLFTASGNGSGRPWNTAAVVFLTARLCRESGLKGVHQKRATGWRTLSPTPAGSGKSARPVPGRTRDTDHRQRLCRAASAGAVKRGARRHPLPEKKRAVARPSPSYFIRHNAPPCRLSTQVR